MKKIYLIAILLAAFLLPNFVLAACEDQCRGLPPDEYQRCVTEKCQGGVKCCVGMPNKTKGATGYCLPPVGGGCPMGGAPNSSPCSSIADCGSSNYNGNSGSTTTFDNPLKFDTIEQVLTSVMSHLQGILATIAIIFIIIGGLMYMLSAGDEKMITRAKACWTAAVIGFAIAIAAPTFLREIKTILGAKDTSDVAGALSLLEIAKNVLNLLLSIVGIIAIISLVIGGAMYLTSYGDEKRIETAKKIVTYAIIGIVIAMGSLIIITQVSRIITGQG